MNQISLDINKSGQIINEPVVLRVGEKDQTITVKILKDGQAYTNFSTATFNANKQNGSIIANDPADISGGVITYSVSQKLVNEFGKITNAYFLIDGKTTTESFVIAVLKGVNLSSDNLNDYIPGMGELDVIYDKWKAKLDSISRELTGIDAPKEVKNVIDNELKGYINQLDDVQNKIDSAQSQIKNLNVPEIGGINLLPNSDSMSGWMIVNYKYIGVRQDFDDILSISNIFQSKNNIHVFQNDAYTYTPTTLKANQEYTFSAYLRGQHNGSTTVMMKILDLNNNKEIVLEENMAKSLSKSWSRPSVTFSVTKDITNAAVIITCGDYYAIGGSIDYHHLQLEPGNIKTPWKPCFIDKLNVSDTSNWQKQKITGDEGGAGIIVSYGVDLKQAILDTPIGFHSIWVYGSAKNIPIAEPFRGFINITNNDSSIGHFGSGILISSFTNVPYSVTLNNNNTDSPVLVEKMLKESDILNKTITATDDTGKTVKLKVTGIS